MAHSGSVIATQDTVDTCQKFPSSIRRRPESGNGKANDVVYLQTVDRFEWRRFADAVPTPLWGWLPRCQGGGSLDGFEVTLP